MPGQTRTQLWSGCRLGLLHRSQSFRMVRSRLMRCSCTTLLTTPPEETCKQFHEIKTTVTLNSNLSCTGSTQMRRGEIEWMGRREQTDEWNSWDN